VEREALRREQAELSPSGSAAGRSEGDHAAGCGEEASGEHAGLVGALEPAGAAGLQAKEKDSRAGVIMLG
jgi:hypothetical protein